MKGWKPYAAMLLVLTLVACGGAQTATTPTTPPAVPTTAAASPATTDATTAPAAATEPFVFDCGDKTKLGKELHIFSWADYWPIEDDNNLLAEFEATCGVKVTLDTFPSNEDLAAKIRAGNAGYDIIIPSDYMVDILARENRLLKLDKALLPNIKNLDPKQMGLYYDPDNSYSLPYQYGMTGIAFDRTKVTPAPDSWDVLFDPAKLTAYKNQASMLDDEREGVGAALKFKGSSYNTTDPAKLAEAKAILQAQKPLLSRYDSENVATGLASGEIVLAQAWNFMAAVARMENPNIEWIVPKEGGVIWQDNLAIPSDAPQPYTAHVFMNNVMDGRVAARISNFTLALSPNAAAQPLLDENYRKLQFGPTDDIRQRLEWIEKGQGNPALYADVWTEIKGQ